MSIDISNINSYYFTTNVEINASYCSKKFFCKGATWIIKIDNITNNSMDIKFSYDREPQNTSSVRLSINNGNNNEYFNIDRKNHYIHNYSIEEFYNKNFCLYKFEYDAIENIHEITVGITLLRDTTEYSYLQYISEKIIPEDYILLPGASTYNDIYIHEIGDKQYIYCKYIDQINNFNNFIQEYSDVEFEVGNHQKIIKAHRVILASRCPSFNTLFEEQAENFDSSNGVLKIELPNENYTSFKALIDYLYKGKCYMPKSKKALNDLLNLAYEYHINNLIESIEEELERSENNNYVDENNGEDDSDTFEDKEVNLYDDENAHLFKLDKALLSKKLKYQEFSNGQLKRKRELNEMDEYKEFNGHVMVKNKRRHSSESIDNLHHVERGEENNEIIYYDDMEGASLMNDGNLFNNVHFIENEPSIGEGSVLDGIDGIEVIHGDSDVSDQPPLKDINVEMIDIETGLSDSNNSEEKVSENDKDPENYGGETVEMNESSNETLSNDEDEVYEIVDSSNDIENSREINEKEGYENEDDEEIDDNDEIDNNEIGDDSIDNNENDDNENDDNENNDDDDDEDDNDNEDDDEQEDNENSYNNSVEEKIGNSNTSSDTESDEIQQEDDNNEYIHESFNNNEDDNEAESESESEKINNEVDSSEEINEINNEEEENKNDKSTENLYTVEENEDHYNFSMTNEEMGHFEDINESNYLGDIELNYLPKEHINIDDDINDFYDEPKKDKNGEDFNDNENNNENINDNDNDELNDEANNIQTDNKLQHENEVISNDENGLEDRQKGNDEIQDNESEFINYDHEKTEYQDENVNVNENLNETENIDDGEGLDEHHLNYILDDQPHIELKQYHVQNEEPHSDEQQIEDIQQQQNIEENQNDNLDQQHNENEQQIEQTVEENPNDNEEQHLDEEQQIEQAIEENLNDNEEQHLDEEQQIEQAIEENPNDNEDQHLDEEQQIEQTIEENPNDNVEDDDYLEEGEQQIDENNTMEDHGPNEEQPIEIGHGDFIEDETQIEQQNKTDHNNLEEENQIEQQKDIDHNNLEEENQIERQIKENQYDNLEENQLNENEHINDNNQNDSMENQQLQEVQQDEETQNEIVVNQQHFEDVNDDLENQQNHHYENNIDDINQYDNIEENELQHIHDQEQFNEDENDNNKIDNTENKNKENNIDSQHMLEEYNYNNNNDNEEIYNSLENKDLNTKEVIISFNQNDNNKDGNVNLDDVIIEEHQTLVDNITNDITEENFDSNEVDTFINDQDNIEEISIDQVYNDEYNQQLMDEDNLSEINENEMRNNPIVEDNKNFYFDGMEEDHNMDVTMDDAKEEELNDQMMINDDTNFNQEPHPGYFNESITNESF